MKQPEYDDYICEKESIPFTEALSIYSAMYNQIDFDDEDYNELWFNYLRSAINYAEIRSGWLLLSQEEKIEKDPVRTALHDKSIISVNMLARFMKSNGKDISWRNELGAKDETWLDLSYSVKTEIHRKRIGDFNCYVALICGLNAR